MKCLKYDPKVHRSALMDLMIKRGMPLKLLTALPANGVVAFQDGTLIASAFVRMAEGQLGIFDGLISNPEAPSALRNEALNLVTMAITATAHNLGLKSIIGWSHDDGTLMRAESHGYHILGPSERVICLSLKP